MQTATALQPGLRIDHYLLQARVGSGSSGEVWLADDGSRPVALKFIHERWLLGDEDDRIRHYFETEIHALESLSDLPGIPTLYGYNLNHERPYLAMQYIDSAPYDELVASGDILLLPLRQRLNLLRQIAGTITEIHQRGIIHRDIKPSNLRGVEQPYLIDFSVAVERSQAGYADTNIGTGIYMPPPDDFPPDELMDNYGFALVTYELLFGRHALFKADTVGADVYETRQRAREYLRDGSWHQPSRLAETDLPINLRGSDLERLDMIFLRALGDRHNRYRDLAQLVADVSTVVLHTDNAAFIDLVPDLPVRRDDIPRAQDYTIQEVQRSARATNLNRRMQRQKSRQVGRWLRVGLALLVLIAGALGILYVWSNFA